MQNSLFSEDQYTASEPDFPPVEDKEENSEADQVEQMVNSKNNQEVTDSENQPNLQSQQINQDPSSNQLAQNAQINSEIAVGQGLSSDQSLHHTRQQKPHMANMKMQRHPHQAHRFRHHNKKQSFDNQSHHYNNQRHHNFHHNQHNMPSLSQKTQQTIMQIIHTLRINQSTPDAAHQLFKTLSETSNAIEAKQRQIRIGETSSISQQASTSSRDEKKEDSVKSVSGDPDSKKSSGVGIDPDSKKSSGVEIDPDSIQKSKTDESVPESPHEESLSSGEQSGGDSVEKSESWKDVTQNKPDDQTKHTDSIKDDLITEQPEISNVPFSIEDQLQLLLTNLQKNVALKKENLINEAELGKNLEAGRTNQENGASNINANSRPGGIEDGSVWSDMKDNNTLITKAYKMINEVIMHPTIMWNRQFFYSLGSMATNEQQIMHDWFQEMNEKQKIYIKEIERANDQLKATAANMFLEKGYSQEQADLFLKKVNFMENREYFFHKRKYMARQQGASLDDDESDDNLSNNQDNYLSKNQKDINQSTTIQSNHQTDVVSPQKKKNLPMASGEKKQTSFFDNLSTSCNLQDMPKREAIENAQNQKVDSLAKNQDSDKTSLQKKQVAFQDRNDERREHEEGSGQKSQMDHQRNQYGNNQGQKYGKPWVNYESHQQHHQPREREGYRRGGGNYHDEYNNRYQPKQHLNYNRDHQQPRQHLNYDRDYQQPRQHLNYDKGYYQKVFHHYQEREQQQRPQYGHHYYKDHRAGGYGHQQQDHHRPRYYQRDHESNSGSKDYRYGGHQRGAYNHQQDHQRSYHYQENYRQYDRKEIRGDDSGYKKKNGAQYDYDRSERSQQKPDAAVGIWQTKKQNL